MKICNDSEGNIHIDMSDPSRLELYSIKDVFMHAPVPLRYPIGFQEALLKENCQGGIFDLIVGFSDEIEKVKEA